MGGLWLCCLGGIVCFNLNFGWNIFVLGSVFDCVKYDGFLNGVKV